MEAVYRYDLFISYAEADQAWVEGYLRPALGLPAARVVTQGDFYPNLPVIDQFEQAVAGSRYTVLVLTPAYWIGPWTAFGKQLAHFASVEKQRNSLVPVLLDQ